MEQIQELKRLFRENFPAAVREEDVIHRILSHPDIKIFHHTVGGCMTAAAVVQGASIYMLAVDAAYRGQGIGSRLLSQAEEHIRLQGYTRVHIGAGHDYLTPGVPVRSKPHDEVQENESLHPSLTDDAWQFLQHRGYIHGWGRCNCFDMAMDLTNYPQYPHAIRENIHGITYRWANFSDLGAISACTNAAQESFTSLYQAQALYDPVSSRRVLLAEASGRICGVLQVAFGVEAPALGSIGCTAVHPDFQGQHIALHLVMLGTGALKAAGLPRAFLGYTYSGLEHLYGKAGYRVCCYYAMAEKSLND